MPVVKTVVVPLLMVRTPSALMALGLAYSPPPPPGQPPPEDTVMRLPVVVTSRIKSSLLPLGMPNSRVPSALIPLPPDPVLLKEKLPPEMTMLPSLLIHDEV